MKRIAWFVLMVGLALGSAARAGQISCHQAYLGFAPAKPWPFDSLDLDVLVRAPYVATNFGVMWQDVLPGAIGARASIEGTTIAVDVYGSPGALPPGLAVVVSPAAPYHEQQLALNTGPLASATYTFVLRVHNLDAQGIDTPCPETSTYPRTMTIRNPVGPYELVFVVEYYNAALDHYFNTADPKEIADLDAGVHAGWKRTGGSFIAFAAGKSGGTGTPVCRYYGLPSAGLDSHFYSANAAECAEIPTKFKGAWQLESANAFETWIPAAELPYCDVGTSNVMRFWNQRADSNHRLTIYGNLIQEMLARGYVMEGVGTSAPVSMCSPW
jgi:hypothetical protein